MSIEENAPSIGFKKRAPKKHNKRLVEVTVKSEDAEDDGDGSDSRVLEDLRFEQELRRRKHGVDISKVITERTENEKGSRLTQTAYKLGSTQYTSRLDTGPGTEKLTKHEDIMEKYVADKLRESGEDTVREDGPSAPTSTPSTTGGIELYQLSADLKGDVGHASGGATSSTADKDSAAEAGNYVGIAEVELPASYALANIRETQESRRKLQARRTGAARGVSPRQKGADAAAPTEGTIPSTLGYRRTDGGYDGQSDRFAKPMSSSEWRAREQLIAKAAAAKDDHSFVPTVPLPVRVEMDDASGNERGSNATKRSMPHLQSAPLASDSRLLESFKKRMRR